MSGYMRSSRGFNPRTRVGCDHPGNVIAFRRQPVSIHAPAWGATGVDHKGHALVYGFNPRTRVGCDSYRYPNASDRAGFNPRTRVGCDSKARRTRLSHNCFNPRTRVGCDYASYPKWCETHRFQSTHPRGVRHSILTGDYRKGGFNPRTRVGCDLVATPTVLTSVCFNPRTRVGCDVFEAVAVLSGQAVSIHAPAWGATSTAKASCTEASSFNPRTRVGCDLI